MMLPPSLWLLRSRWLFTLIACSLTAASYAQWANPADDVPAYHPSAPLKIAALPPILTPNRANANNFRYPWQVHVYQKVAQIGSVAYQLPCNCRCDRALGHTSLRSCFETLHGTECDVCAVEGVYAWEKSRAGWTPAQIRAGIARHEYESIDLARQ